MTSYLDFQLPAIVVRSAVVGGMIVVGGTVAAVMETKMLIICVGNRNLLVGKNLL